MRAGTVVPPLTGEVPQGDSEWRRALEGLRGAYADKTITECAKHFRAFSRWCFAEGVDALPASAETVADHVDSIFPRYGRRSIESRLASVRRVHQLLDLPDATRALVVQLAFRRGVRTYGGYSRQARGLTVAYRDRLLAACPSTLLGLRDRAMISLGYDTLCRRSELVALQIEDITRLPDGTARILVRRSKTDPFGGGGFSYASERALADVDAWLAAAAVRDGPILRGIYKTVAGSRQLHPRVVNRRLRELARLAQLDTAYIQSLTSHSLRVGAAQDLAVAGRTLLEIMRAGRWRDVDAVSHYVREAPVNVWAPRAGVAAGILGHGPSDEALG